MLGFLSALLVKTSFQFCLFLTFFYLDSGGLISCISKPDCSVISKRYYSDVSGLFFFFIYLIYIFSFFPSCLCFSLILTHLSSVACYVLVLSPLNLDYITFTFSICLHPPPGILPPEHLFPSFLMLFLPFSCFPCPVVFTVPVGLIPLQIL